MTHNGPLFISVIIALMIEHVLFQVIPTTTTKPRNTTKKEKNPDSSIVIEVAKPCCQCRAGEEDDSSCGDDDSSCGKNRMMAYHCEKCMKIIMIKKQKVITKDNFNSCNCSITSTPKD